MAIDARPAGVGRRNRQRRPPEFPAPGDVGRAEPNSPLMIAARWSRRLALGTVAVTGAALPWMSSVPASVVLTLAAIGFIAGVPHGAVDHLLATRLTGTASIAVAGAGYAALAAAAWVLMVSTGPLALTAIIMMSAVHFGLGELDVSRRLTGWQPPRAISGAIGVAGCGALMLPLARTGDQIDQVAHAVSPALAAALGTDAVRIGLVLTWAAAAVIAVAGALRAGHRAVALDVMLIGALGAVAPPLVAFAVWFGGWHALRHGARILTVEPGCAALVAAGGRRAAVRRLARLAALPSAAALGVLAALSWATAVATAPAVMVAEVLRLLLALTVPHMMVVLWLDRTGGDAVSRR